MAKKKSKNKKPTKLKLCPFCGGDAIVRALSSFTKPPSKYWIGCQQCDAMSTISMKRSEVVAAWNRRAK